MLSAGILDTTFGTSGILPLTGERPTDVRTIGAAQTPDGKTIVLGVESNSDASIVLARFDADGVLDDTFGTSGVLVGPPLYSTTSNPLSGLYSPSAVAIDQEGRIYIGSQLGLIRLQADGTLDRSYGVEGFVSTRRKPFSPEAIGIASDGSAWIGGSDRNSFGVLHLNADGRSIAGTQTITHFFNSRGKVTYSQIHALAFDALGRLIAVGGGGSGYDIARFNADGSLDGSFGNNGTMSIPGNPIRQRDVAQRGFYFDAVAFDSAGDIVTGGGVPISRPGVMEVARVTASGVLDSAFGHGGVTQLTGPASSRGHSGLFAAGLAVLPSGQILVSGTLTGPYVNAAVTARLNSDGSLDQTYGDDVGIAGLRLLAPSVSDTEFEKPFAAGLLTLPDGTLLMPTGGGTDASPYRQLRVFGLEASGEPDATYGQNGQALATIEQPDIITPTFIGAASDGSFYVGEQRDRQSTLTRYTAAGQIDPAFGDGGTMFGVTPLAVLPNGSFYAQAPSSAGGVELLRYTPVGTLDTAFGSDGAILFDDGTGYTSIQSVIPLADGSLLIDVRAADQGDVVHRVNPAGQSIATLTFGSVTADGTTNALGAIAVSPDNNYVFAIVLGDGFDPHSYLHRYDATTLALDTSFGNSGTVQTSSIEPQSMVAEPDDSVDLLNYDNGIAVTRVDSSGTVFAQSGIADTGPGDESQLLLQSDGKFISYPSSLEFGPLVLDRFNADGSPDTTFGDDGSASLFANEIQNYGPPPFAAAIQSAGDGEKLLVASVGSPPLTDGGFVARIDL